MSDDDIDEIISIAHQNKKDLNLTIMDLSNNIKDVTFMQKPLMTFLYLLGLK